LTTTMYMARIVFVEHGNRRRDAVLSALNPEAMKTLGNAEVAISCAAGGLVLRFRAHTVPSLRALMNSYLRWLNMMDQVLEILEGSEDATEPVARPTACGTE
jgi:tRNA threonylcarbamoyladenosine modification (KEOPS) complex  Pcc1 subunit